MSTPRDWSYLIDKTCSFDGPAKGQRLVGLIKAAVDAPPTPTGGIPDAVLTIQGASGRKVTVNLVAQHVQLTGLGDDRPGALVWQDGTAFKFKSPIL